jgi:4'-phosphopantetheinyl transferase
MKTIDRGPTLSIIPGEVHVWIFNLDQPCQARPHWEQILSEEEAARSQRYRFKKDRLRFIARRALLRQLLGRYTGLKPAEIVYHTNPFGKLFLPSQLIRFNLSACQDRVVIAFVLEKEIGVDIERVHPLPDLARMAERWFSPEEYAGLSELAPELQVDAFFHTWTQKEAFIKAHGEGLSWPLKDFSVSVNPNQPGRLLSIKGASAKASHWKMTSHIPEAGWRVAVCLQAETAPQVLWHMPELADFVSTVTF